MATDTQKIIEEATKLGKLIIEHPAIAKYREATKALQADPDASRLMGEFERMLENLMRLQASGAGITDAQRRQLETSQSLIASNLRYKAMQLAQVEYTDLLRRVNQTILGQVGEAAGTAGPGGGAGGGAVPAGPQRPSGMRLVT